MKDLITLYDNDTIHPQKTGSYLSRSAQVLDVAKLAGCVADRSVRLLLDKSGPRYVPKGLRPSGESYRCVGYTYYTRAFANTLISNSMYVNGRLKPLRDLFIRACREHDGELWSLIPRNINVWFKLCEDIFFSPMMRALERSFLKECYENEEFMYLAVDATVRVAFNIKGQASYRAPKDEKAHAAIADSESLRRVFAARGRTGAVICMDLVRTEDASDVAKVLQSSVPAEYRRQTTVLATDNPSGKLWTELLTILPCLSFLLLDPIHLVIVYRQCFGGKNTSGSTVLRLINLHNVQSKRASEQLKELVIDRASKRLTERECAHVRVCKAECE